MENHGPPPATDVDPAAEQPPRRAMRHARKQRRRLSVIGVAGELLITAGVLVFLYLGWQLWFNELIVGEQQRQAAADLGEQWDSQIPDPGNIDIGELEGTIDFGDPVVAPTPADTETFAILYAPRFGDTYERPIAEGVSLPRVLNTVGIGRYPDTQMPGELGNFALASHRLTYGGAFADIHKLRVGDRLYVRTEDGYYTYVFRNMEYVWPQGVGVKDPVPQQPDTVEITDRLLTLTTCHPVWSTAERIIAYAALESWRPADAGPPADIAHLVKGS